LFTGLVNRIVAQDQLLPESIAYAQQLASRAPIAQQFAKEVIYRAHGLAMDEALRLESQSFRILPIRKTLPRGIYPSMRNAKHNSKENS